MKTTLAALFISAVVAGCSWLPSHPIPVDSYCTIAKVITFDTQAELDALPPDLVKQIAENNRNWKLRCDTR